MALLLLLCGVSNGLLDALVSAAGCYQSPDLPHISCCVQGFFIVQEDVQLFDLYGWVVETLRISIHQLFFRNTYTAFMLLTMLLLPQISKRRDVFNHSSTADVWDASVWNNSTFKTYEMWTSLAEYSQNFFFFKFLELVPPKNSIPLSKNHCTRGMISFPIWKQFCFVFFKEIDLQAFIHTHTHSGGDN